MAPPHPGEQGDTARQEIARGGTFRKWTKRLPKALVVLVALFTFVKGADWVWFRTQLPIGFAGANWSGSWQTRQYWGMSGRLVVRLPDPLPEGQNFKAEALVYYPVYSVWRTGQFVKMEFQGHFSPDSPASAGQSMNRIRGGKLKFKGTAGGQVVEYAAILDESRTRIVGGYLSTYPDDFGCFHLTNP